MKVRGGKLKQCRCIFIKDGTLIKCGLYTTRNAVASGMLLLASLRDLMVGGMVKARTLIQVISKNRGLLVAFQDDSKRPSNLKALMHDIVKTVNVLSAMINLVPSSKFLDGFHWIFK